MKVNDLIALGVTSSGPTEVHLEWSPEKGPLLLGMKPGGGALGKRRQLNMEFVRMQGLEKVTKTVTWPELSAERARFPASA